MANETSLPAETLKSVLARLAGDQKALAVRFPGESGGRQPVHTVYGGAHLFKADTAKKLGEMAVKALEHFAPDGTTLAEAIGIPKATAGEVRARVLAKLKREAVEDFRIDFEDGYGIRPDAEEDAAAIAAAQQVVEGMKANTLPPFIGIRIKTFSGEQSARAARTLDLFLTTLVRGSGGKLPANFVVTLPKITAPAQVGALIDLFEGLEKSLGLAPGTLKMEMMVETTLSIVDSEGRYALPKMLDAARGRCSAAHFGTYDYTASCNVTAAHQKMRHPACDHAKSVMQVTLAGTGVWLSDGATNVMPVGPHRAAKDAKLTADQEADNRRVVHAAWRLHADDIRHSLIGGFYQGWDLHPAQLVTRYATVYGFFLEGLAPATERLKNFVEKATQATLVGDVFDDAATGQGLLNFFLRGVNCGALTEAETLATGLTVEEVRSRSFVKVLENRKKR